MTGRLVCEPIDPRVTSRRDVPRPAGGRRTWWQHLPQKLPAHYAVLKSEGDGAVQPRIHLLPDWQSARARRVDAVERLLESGVEVPEIETSPNVISWFDIEDPDGNEMRWYQVLTSDPQVRGERQQP
jgi:hypothetical protein